MTQESLYYSGESMKAQGTEPFILGGLGTIRKAGNSLCSCAGSYTTQEVVPHM